MGGTATADIELTITDDRGLSGFIFDVTIENPEVAEIAEVTLPPFGLFLVSDLPSDTANIRALDLAGIIEGSVGDMVIATLTFDLLEAGETNITLSVTSLDDDDGSTLIPFVNITPGLLTAE